MLWILLATIVLGCYLSIVNQNQPNKINKNSRKASSTQTKVESAIGIGSISPDRASGLSSSTAATGSFQKIVDPSKRPYINCYVDKLERIADSEWHNIEVLTDIHHELSFRSRGKASVLRKRISERLVFLQSAQFSWPTTVANIGLQNLHSDVFKYEEGLLKQYGYKVGIYGLSQRERREICDAIFLYSLIPMEDHRYINEWGDPKTDRRLQKLAESIAAFTRNAKRRKMVNFGQAIQDWESDLAYLKSAYYDNCFSFKWPRT